MLRRSVGTDHVLDAATDLFARHGFEHVTTADIAKAAGVAKGVLYLRFVGKDKLLDALLDREFASVVRAVAELVDDDHRGGLLSRLYLHSLRAVHASLVLTAFYSASLGELRVVGRLVRNRPANRYPVRELVGARFFEDLHRAEVDPATLARLLAVWSIGLAASSPHDDVDDLVVGIGELIARAVDADVTDSTPGEIAFAELARTLIDHAEQAVHSTGASAAVHAQRAGREAVRS